MTKRTVQDIRVHSIGFDRPLDVWVDSLVDFLREAGFPKAGRSEVVRVALEQLKKTVCHASRPHLPVSLTAGVRFGILTPC